MIIIFNKETGGVNQAIWGDELPGRFELSGDEGCLVVDNDIDKHKLHCCKLKLDTEGKPEEIEEPIYEITKNKGDPLLEEKKIKSWKKHKIKKVIGDAEIEPMDIPIRAK